MQSKLHSFIESIVNILIGVVVGVLSQLLIFPMFGIVVQLHENFMIAGWFTAISLARSYIVRRWFAKRTD